MRNLLERYLPLRAPQGGEGAATPVPAPAAPAPVGQPPAPAAPPAAPPAPADGPYRPEGLPDTMYGTNDRETIDKMHTALNGYRQRDASVPSTPDAYQTFEIDKAPEAIRPHLESLAKDPLFAAAAKVAMEEKVPVGTMQKLTMALYQQAADAGVLDAVVDPVKEREALLPDSAKALPKAQQDAAIDARLQENEDWIKLLTKPGADGKSALDPKVGENALLMLMDTALGNQFIEFVRGQMTGAGKAQPFGGTGSSPAASSARDGLRTRLAAPEMQKGHPAFDQAAYDALMQDYQKTVGV